ncbi:hypothetical protein SLEP1_g9441 [Rubroshorea leprosula]|uniref:Uncharacterized protein n=1 Tax=Rubroshorea leprosula TaxID=152421 RepID=A0AAV5IG52_9ROSI|nr:hypothetical protein SLEP1_g9441 [Rubroshorea leprosula]
MALLMGIKSRVRTMDGRRKGSAVEHVSKFLDAMGAHARDRDLCLCKFSKSFSDKAYTCEERITILDLHKTLQDISEDLMAYVKRFRDLALYCYGGHAESFLVEICINNMFSEYRVVLENIGIRQGQKKRDRDAAWPPPIPLTIEELDMLLNQWIVDSAITQPQLHREPSNDDKCNLKYYRYHRFVHHVTTDCFSSPRGASQSAKCPTLEAGNEILAKRLDSSSEADHLILPDELPTLHEAQLALTSLESYEAIDLEDDPTTPKHKILGFLVSKHGISVDPAKSEAIRAMLPLKKLKQLRSFIGEKEEQQRAFSHLQDLILKLPTISIPVRGGLRRQRVGEEQPVYYVNRNLKGAESSLSGAEAGVVLRDDKGHDMVFSFKLDFQCTNNIAKYEAYLIGLAMTKEADV